jgi:hypothetical protein
MPKGLLEYQLLKGRGFQKKLEKRHGVIVGKALPAI